MSRVPDLLGDIMMARTILVALACGICGVAMGAADDPPAPETGVIVLEDPLSAPDNNGPTCGEAATYALRQVAGGLHELFVWSQGVTHTSGYFVESDSVVLVANEAIEIFGRVGEADWILATGHAAIDGGELVETGMLVSIIRIDDGEGGIEEFSTASTVPIGFATANIAAARSAIAIAIVPEGGGGGMAAASLGSSCSCDVCPLGGRFWVPFVVVGIGGSPAGQGCCRIACNIACERLHSGMSMAEAWTIGQGTWVTCMICEG